MRYVMCCFVIFPVFCLSETLKKTENANFQVAFGGWLIKLFSELPINKTLLNTNFGVKKCFL